MVISHDLNLVNGSKARTISIINGKLDKDTGTKETNKIKETPKEDEDIEKKKADVAPQPKKEDINPEFESLSEGLRSKLKKFAIKSPEILLNITTGDLKNMKLSKQEHKELESFVKNYLSKDIKNA